MGMPVAATVWSFVVLIIVIAACTWLAVKIAKRTGSSSDVDGPDDTPR